MPHFVSISGRQLINVRVIETKQVFLDEDAAQHKEECIHSQHHNRKTKESYHSDLNPQKQKMHPSEVPNAQE